MSKLVYTSLLLFTFWAVDQKQLKPVSIHKIKEYLVTESVFKGTQSLQFSKIIRSYRIISLETKAICLIKDIRKISGFGSRLFILNSANNGGIFIFDKNGKFINSVKRNGQGPGEYIKLLDFSIDHRGWIYLLCKSGKIILLDNSLKYVKEFKLSGSKEMFEGARLAVGEDFIAITGVNPFEKKLVVTDLEGGFKNFLASDMRQGSHFKENLSELNDEVLFNNRFCDTIFRVNSDRLTPVIYFNFGKRSLGPIEYRKASNSQSDPPNPIIGHDYLQIFDFEECNSLIINTITGMIGKDATTYLQLIRKTDNAQLFRTFVGSNDYFDLHFNSPIGNVWNGEYLATYYQSVDLVEKFNSLKKNMGSTAVLQKYPVLDSVCRAIDIDSNPVLFLFK